MSHLRPCLCPFGFCPTGLSFADTAVRVAALHRIFYPSVPTGTSTSRSIRQFQVFVHRQSVWSCRTFYSLNTAFFSTLICCAWAIRMALRQRSNCPRASQSILAPCITAVLDLVSAAGLRARGNHSGDRLCSTPPSNVLGCNLDHPLQIMRTSSGILGIVYSFLTGSCPCLPHSRNWSFPAGSGRRSRQAPVRVLPRIRCPCPVPGIIAGSMLVFISGDRRIRHPTLLGGPNNLMIGRSLGRVSSATAIGRRPPPCHRVLVMLVGPIALYQHTAPTARALGGQPHLALPDLDLGSVSRFCTFRPGAIGQLLQRLSLVSVWAAFSTTWYAELLPQ